MENVIIIRQHGDNDISAWSVDLPDSFFDSYETSGESVRGTAKEVIKEVLDDLARKAGGTAPNVVVGPEDLACAGCLSSDCGICPKDDGSKCHGCPCDNCHYDSESGNRSNYYDNYSINYTTR